MGITQSTKSSKEAPESPSSASTEDEENIEERQGVNEDTSEGCVEDSSDLFEGNRSETELSLTTRRQQSDLEWHMDNKSTVREGPSQENRQTPFSRNVSSGYHSMTRGLEYDQSQTGLSLGADFFIESEFDVMGQCEQGARPKTLINDTCCDANVYEDSSVNSETENESEYNADSATERTTTQDQIIANYRYLKDNIDVDSALDVLTEFFSDRDIEDICSIATRHRQVDLLLRTLLRHSRISEAFYALTESFKTNGSSFINDELQKQVLHIASSSLTLTVEEERQNMRKYKRRLLDEIDPQYAHEFFLMMEAISLDKYEEIEDEKTPNGKIKQLLEHIDENLPECYDVLVAYLSDKEKNETKDDSVSSTNSLAFLLSRSWTDEPTHITDKMKPTRTSKPKRQIKRESNQRRPGHLNIIPGADFQLHITFDESKQDKEVSERIVAFLNEAQFKIEINHKLIPLTSCSIKSSSSGSIVIWFKKFRGQVRNFFKRDQLTLVIDIIEMIFNHRGLSAIIPRGNIKFALQLELHISSEETFTVSISERIQCYRQFLIEELDGQKLLAHLRQRSDVSIDEESFIMKQTSRRSRLSAILDILLGKGSSDIEEFKAYLKKTANSIYVLMWPSNETDTERYVTSMELNLDQFYQELIDRVQPSIFLKLDEDFHMPRPLVDELLRNPRRTDRAKMIVQHVLCQNMTTRRQFLQMLLFYHQLNIGELQTTQRLLPLVYKKRNIAKYRRSKSTKVHAASERLPIQLGKFCLKSTKGVSKAQRNVQVTSSSKVGTLEKSSNSAGEIIKESSSSSTHIVSEELDVTCTHLDGAMRDGISIHKRPKSPIPDDIDSAYGSLMTNKES